MVETKREKKSEIFSSSRRYFQWIAFFYTIYSFVLSFVCSFLCRWSMMRTPKIFIMAIQTKRRFFMLPFPLLSKRAEVIFSFWKYTLKCNRCLTKPITENHKNNTSRINNNLIQPEKKKTRSNWNCGNYQFL